jgi:hypothetical protein
MALVSMTAAREPQMIGPKTASAITSTSSTAAQAPTGVRRTASHFDLRLDVVPAISSP